MSRTRHRKVPRGAMAALLAFVPWAALASCAPAGAGAGPGPIGGTGPTGGTGPAGGSATSRPVASGESTLTVFAAASLTGAFTTLARGFEARHAGVHVRYDFDGSSALVDQLAAGAPADVLATADEATMARASAAHLTAEPSRVFATNVLTLVVAPGNPGHITGLDASLSGRKLVVCAPAVPCGSATKSLAATLGVDLRPVSEETKVTDVLGRVTSGEADAGIVYATDARSAGIAVTAVPVPGAERVVNRYAVAGTAAAADPTLARAFVEDLAGADGRRVLSDYGFGTP